jgi:VanZ family protein
MHVEPRPLTPRGLARFLPPLLWMGLIALGSSSFLSGGRTGPWMLALLGALAPWASATLLDAAHFGLRKVGHLVEFGVLAVLWYRALAPSPRAVTAAFVLAAAYGGLDELRQGLDPSRVPAVGDMAVDALGALLGLAAWTEPGRLRAGALRVAGWGVGVLAGLAGLGVALDATLGRPAADVGVGALGLGLVAVGLARVARSGVSAGRPPPDPP